MERLEGLHVENPGSRPIRFVLSLMREESGSLLVALGAFILKHSPAWLFPLLTANLIDIIVGHRPVSGLFVNAAVFLVLLALNVPLHLLYIRCMYGSVRRIGARLRSTLCSRAQRLSIGYLSDLSAGVLQHKVIRDVDSIEVALRQTGDLGLGGVATLAGALVVTALRAPAFLPIFIIVVPVSALLVRKLKSQMRVQNDLARQTFEKLSTEIAEMSTLVPITRAHALEEAALARVDRSVADALAATRRSDLVNGRFAALSWMFFNTVSTLCLICAAFAAYYGRLNVTPGTVVLIGTYFSYLTGAVANLLNLTPVIARGLSAVGSVTEVLMTSDLEDNSGKPAVEAVDGRFEFEKVSYSYGNAERPAVDEVSFVARPGEIIALVGPSGAGKSTILSLLMGFLRPASGRVLLDGEDMEGLDRRSFRRFLSVVPQESVLFEGTIRENVAYGLPEVSDEAVRQALRDADAFDFVERLPGGLESVIGTRGARLSGGQRQRLSIARALIRDPKVLILDEATSALDSRSEAHVQRALARLAVGRTVIVVAHRLSTVRQADRILVLDEGRLVEDGSHDDLLSRGGVYAELQAAQLV